MSAQDQNPFLPTSFKYDENNLIPRLQDNYSDVAQAVNQRELGIYPTETIRTGAVWQIGDTQHAIFRKVIDFGALPNSSLKFVPHGITVNSNTMFINVFGVAKNPGIPQWLPLPFSSGTLANVILLYVTANDVVVSTGINRTNYSETYICLEFWQA